MDCRWPFWFQNPNYGHLGVNDKYVALGKSNRWETTLLTPGKYQLDGGETAARDEEGSKVSGMDIVLHS